MNISITIIPTVDVFAELGSDGCISEYSWASGGTGGLYGKKWGEHLPTDAGVSHSIIVL